MQQHNVNWRSLPSKSPGANSSQRIIKIEEAPAYHRSKQRVESDRVNKLERDLQRQQPQQILTAAIGDCQILAIDPVVALRCEAQPQSTANLQLVELCWQGAFKLDRQPQADRYIIYLVESGSLTQTIEPERGFCCSPETATIVSPDVEIASIASNEGKALLMAIDRQAIEATVSKLLARPIKHPLIFHPQVDLNSHLGLSLKRFGQFLWEAATHVSMSADFSALVLHKLERAFLDCAIEGLPSNYSDELLYYTDGALACHVRKAQAFIKEHLHEKIELADIAAAARICPRLLQKAFSHHCGRSPMRFLTEARLQSIRGELERSTGDTKIVDVMMNYGFTQGGKFAKEYQQLFGEKPSETLKRSNQFRDRHTRLWQEIDDDVSARVAGGRSLPINMLPQAELPQRWPSIDDLDTWMDAFFPNKLSHCLT